MVQDHWTDHKIIVTGGATGLGAATVAAFARLGARVVFCGLDEDMSDDVAALLSDRILYRPCDVRDERAVAQFVDYSVRQMGGLTGAVNAAAISHHAGKLADLRPAMVEDVWRTNVMGVWYAMRHQITAMLAYHDSDHMPDQLKGGAIINVASILSAEPAQWMAAYGMSKYAVAGLSETAALDYQDSPIRINAVSPGPIKTPMLDRALADVDGDMSKFAGGFPPGGPADATVIADLFTRLMGQEGRHIRGKNIILSGDGTPQEDIFRQS